MIRRTILAAGALLFFWLAVSSLVDDSPTMDEQNHIARGLALLRTGDPRLSVEHPPLVNVLSALPLLMLSDLRLPLDDASWQRQPADFFWYVFAEKFLWQYNPQLVPQIVFLARLPIVWLMLLLGMLAERFAAALWHRRAGIAAALLIWFDPNILAHGRYSTTDLGGAAFLLLAVVLLWQLWQRPSTGRIALAGIGLGLAFAAKLSALSYVPFFALVALLPVFPGRWSGGVALRRLAAYLAAGALAVLVVWSLFAFEWGPYAFLNPPLTALNAYSGPLPTFLSGVERIALTADAGRPAFLAGRFSDDGFRAYFPVAFAVKTPLPTLLLLLVAVPVLLNAPATRRKALFLLIPPLLYFGSAIGGGLNIGYRHLLPMLPPLYVLAAGLVPRRWRHDGTLTLRSFIVLFGLAGTLLGTLWIHPHYISYFNQIVGPANGWQVLVDSNVDWGQELIRLRRWMEENDVASVKLAYFGSADPARYVAFEPLPGEPRFRDLWWAVPFDRSDPAPGVYVISAHNLQEMPLRPEEKTVYAYFRSRAPDARIGYSLLIYRVAK